MVVLGLEGTGHLLGNMTRLEGWASAMKTMCENEHGWKGYPLGVQDMTCELNPCLSCAGRCMQIGRGKILCRWKTCWRS